MTFDFNLYKKELISLFFKRLDLKETNYIYNLLEYNTFEGKFTRSLLTFLTIKEYKEITLSDIFISYLNEVIQGSFIILDDIMDKSEVRRGKKCWYLVNGYKAIKDALFLLSCVRKFTDGKISNLFDTMFFRSCLGQTHDSFSDNFRDKQIQEVKKFYQMNNYKLICLNKNAFYTFYFPIKLGLLYCKAEENENLLKVCTLLGELHQMQDDYINFLPNTNKSCLDVKQRKNTWFMCKYFEKSDGNEFYNDVLLENKLKSYINDFFIEEKKCISQIQSYDCGKINNIIEKCVLLLNKRKN